MQDRRANGTVRTSSRVVDFYAAKLCTKIYEAFDEKFGHESYKVEYLEKDFCDGTSQRVILIEFPDLISAETVSEMVSLAGEVRDELLASERFANTGMDITTIPLDSCARQPMFHSDKLKEIGLSLERGSVSR